MIVPPYLKKGDTIGITCPAGYMPLENAQTCIDTLQAWGYKVIVGKTLGSGSQNYFSASDSERTLELQAMMDDPSIHAILCGRGGYGMSRIIDQLSFKKLKKNPKWIIGFSDITVMHTHLFSQHKIASLHAPMAAAFNEDGFENEYIKSLRKALIGKKANYQYPAHPANKEGASTGKLIGGNLALLVHVIGTSSDFNTKNNILFLEDIGEYLYNADRMLYQLKRSNKLDKISGLIFGGFTDMKDTVRPFGKTMEQILEELAADLNIPVCFNFPVSHGKENVALKIGVEYQLKVSKSKVQLKEL
ncbi:MAG: LD-carboxypeptidase [Gloeobacteraceae cyanobacterium ES-bin-316]|nr:LD-carboxypeptidase [Ferruginibacter sp.]